MSGPPDVQGLANWFVTNQHLIRGDRMSLFGDNLASATALSIGGTSCTILDPTSGDFFGYDTISFTVPPALRPSQSDGTVSLSVSNPDGTWTSSPDTMTFNVARGGDWIQPPDVASTTRVLPSLEENNVVEDTQAAVLAELIDPTYVGWVGGGGHIPFDPLAVLDFQSDFAFTGDTWAAYTLQSLWAVDAANWTKTNHFPSGGEIPTGALGYEMEGQNTQDWSADGIVHYPATVTIQLWASEVAAEKHDGASDTPWEDNSDVDDPGDWFTGNYLEARALPAGPDGPVSPSAAAADVLLGSVNLEPAITDGLPARPLTFTVTEDQLRFALLFDLWATEAWPGFPPTPPDDSYPHYRRHFAVTVDESGGVGVAYRFAATTYTPLRYRFVFEVAGGVTPLRQRQTSTGIHTAGTSLRQRQHHFGLRQRQTGI